MKLFQDKISFASLKAMARGEFRSFINITAGTLIMCFGIAALIEPYQFASTGVTGIGLIMTYLWGISPVWFITGANALLLLWGYKELSPRFAFWTVYVTVITSLALPFFEMFQYPIIQNTVMAALLSGVTCGLGLGFMFREGASSGGTDVLTAVAKKRWGTDMGSASFYINIVVLLMSFVAVDLERVLMGGLTLYVESVTIDSVIRAFDRRAQLFIISSRTQDIKRFITDTLDRSATVLRACGAYSNEEKDMLMVVLTRRQAMELKRFVFQSDPSAFLIMGDVSEVVGEGFKHWQSQGF
ncbi:MAG: YitT family protein [Pyramidobacter sp.]|nr:YitT family protein [Pyramidobacter sp.]